MNTQLKKSSVGRKTDLTYYDVTNYHFETSLENKELGRIVAVADNGMNAQENMYLLTKKGNGYIISKSVKKSWTQISPWATDENGYTCITNSAGEVVFKYKSRIYDRTLESSEKDENGKKKKITVKEKEIIYWSKKHYERERHQNNKFIEYLESCKNTPDKLKDKKFN